MSTTGRRLTAPAHDLVEIVGANGLKHLAVAFRDPWRGHAAITSELAPRLGFLEQPITTGIARLVAHDPDDATFVYPTGTVWTIAEVVRSYADTGAAAGVKAGLELCYLVAELLVEAADAAPGSVPGHGNVNPWTVLLKGDGQPLVIGYGLPQVELTAWREDNRLAMVEDSFRYAPPERIDGGVEDLSSDLFSLALVALEVMVGRPVYDGVLADVRQQATRGEGMRRLYQWRERLPQTVREVIGRALKPDPDTRFPNGLELVYAVHDLLGSIDVEGPSLMEVMAKVRASEKRGRAIKGGQTAMLTPEQVAELAADLDPVEDRPLKPPRRPRPDGEDGEERPRWSKPARRAAEEPVAARPPAAAAAPTPVASPAGSGPAASSAAGSTPAASSPGATSERPLRRNLEPEPSAPRRRLRPDPPARPGAVDAAAVDLSGPDDVELEVATHTGGHAAPVPTVPAPAAPQTHSVARERVRPAPTDDTGLRKSAAAALLEKMRTSGDRRRRRGDDPPSASTTTSVQMPSDVVAEEVPAVGTAPPLPAPPAAPAVSAPPASVLRRSPPLDSVATSQAGLPPRRMVDVSWGSVRVSLPWRTGERPASLALRAAFAMGGYPVDPLGRPLGGPRIQRAGAALPPDLPIEPGEYELAVVAAEVRRVEIQIQIEPPMRFQTLVSTAIPIGWVVGGLVRLAALPPGNWAAWVDGAPIDGDRLTLDVLGASAVLVLGVVQR